MGTRLDLQYLLEAVLGSTNVYFQPPSTVRLKYPCIVYKRIGDNVEYADNSKYRRLKKYLITVMDRNPDSLIPDKVSDLPYCEFTNQFKSNNLNHDVFTKYY